MVILEVQFVLLLVEDSVEMNRTVNLQPKHNELKRH